MKINHYGNAKIFAFSLILLGCLTVTAQLGLVPEAHAQTPQCYSPYFAGYNYQFGIRDAASDKKSYMSGETVTINGHVGLLTEEVWGDGCGNFYYANSYWGDPSGATVTL